MILADAKNRSLSVLKAKIILFWKEEAARAKDTAVGQLQKWIDDGSGVFKREEACFPAIQELLKRLRSLGWHAGAGKPCA